MRKAGIESFRFFAILAIVTIHVYPSSDLAGSILNQMSRFAVPFFFIISGYFFYKKVTSNIGESLNYLFKYELKLVYIYLFWYLVFAYWLFYSPDNWVNIVQNGLLFEFQKETLLIWTEFKSHLLYYLLAGGRAEHLWFIPSLGIAIVFLYLSTRLNLFVLGLVFSVFLFAIALLLEPYSKSALALPLHVGGRNGPFFSSIFVFIGAAIAKYNIRTSSRTALLLALSGLVLQLAEAFLIEHLWGIPLKTHNFVISTILFGSGVAMYAMVNEKTGVRYKIDQLGKFTLGIYVSHLLITQLLNSIDLMPATGFARVILVTFLSLIFVMMLARIPLIRKVVV